jgi:hypothetical protein
MYIQGPQRLTSIEYVEEFDSLEGRLDDVIATWSSIREKYKEEDIYVEISFSDYCGTIHFYIKKKETDEEYLIRQQNENDYKKKEEEKNALREKKLDEKQFLQAQVLVLQKKIQDLGV